MIPGAVNRGKPIDVPDWTKELWRHFDSCGEFTNGVSWIANGLSRINLFAARAPEGPGDNPTPISLDDENITPAEIAAYWFVAAIGGGPVGQGQIMQAFGQHLTVAGIGWLLAEPDLDDDLAEDYVSWQVLASTRVRQRLSGGWEVQDQGPTWRPVHPNALLVKVWRKHPERTWEPTCPARAGLIILDQIETLTLSITAVATSRLAGNGILAIPSEFTFPPSQIVSTPNEGDPDPENVPDPADLFVETFIQTSLIPIKDRGSAAAVVPLVIQVPGEHLAKLVHLTFEMQGDERVLDKLEMAIRRLALTLDMPPEALLGLGATNHWNAAQITENAVALHFSPAAEAVCEALSVGFLTAALTAAGFAGDEAMVWYDATDISMPPDRTEAAKAAYDNRELSGVAYLRELGLERSDAPDDDEVRRRVLIDMMLAAPESLGPILLQTLGYIDAATAEQLARSEPDAATPAAGSAGPLLAAADGLVFRALERAGQRLRSAAGRNVVGGAAGIDCPDPTRLHLTVEATAHATLDDLLDGAWGRVPEIADRYHVPADHLAASLNAYTRSLIASGHEHTVDRLAEALGVG